MGSTRQKTWTRRKAIKAQKRTWIMVSEEDEGTNDVNVGKGFYKSIQELWSWVYIYSSGSREAQRLIFGNTVYGDLRKYLCGFFDTTIGHKRESSSYFEISQSLGVDKPSQILFVTDVYQEAVAAKAAGLDVLIAIRPGNGPLPEAHGFRTIKSFSEI